MPDLREFRLGIIGGCLSHQSDISHSRLFHRQLDRMLQDGQGIRLKVAITRHFDRDYSERLGALIEEADVDGVLLHLRVVFVAKSVLLVNRLEDGKRYYRLHPFMFKRNETGWNRSVSSVLSGASLFASREPRPSEGRDEDPFELPTPSKKIFGFRLRTLNLIAGTLFGLDNWAIADELAMFARFVESCKAHRLPLFVLGPTPVTTYTSETRLWRKMNSELAFRLPERAAPFCLLESMTDAAGTSVLRGDGLHLNENGHTFVAERLHQTMTPWIQQILVEKKRD
jgi:hypothetical protein